MTRFILPYRRPDPLPMRRAAMPTQAAAGLKRPGYRLVPVNEPSMPPHYHVQLSLPERIAQPEAGMQAVLSSVPRGLISCADADCQWYAHGREGISDGEPFRHPQGVDCGDERGCLDDNCPCPDNVIEWPDGQARGHIVPCRFCDGSYRLALRSGIRPVTFDEYFYRLDEGADALVTIKKRGL